METNKNRMKKSCDIFPGFLYRNSIIKWQTFFIYFLFKQVYLCIAKRSIKSVFVRKAY